MSGSHPRRLWDSGVPNQRDSSARPLECERACIGPKQLRNPPELTRAKSEAPDRVHLNAGPRIEGAHVRAVNVGHEYTESRREQTHRLNEASGIIRPTRRPKRLHVNRSIAPRHGQRRLRQARSRRNGRTSRRVIDQRTFRRVARGNDRLAVRHWSISARSRQPKGNHDHPPRNRAAAGSWHRHTVSRMQRWTHPALQVTPRPTGPNISAARPGAQPPPPLPEPGHTRLRAR